MPRPLGRRASLRGKDRESGLCLHPVIINVQTTQFLFSAHAQTHQEFDDLEEEDVASNIPPSHWQLY
jgi:hypothetical protein